jgi:hypothetical protein
LFSYLAGGFAPVWTTVLELESEDRARETARDLMRREAEATSSRPLTLLVGLGEDEEEVRWIGSWRWSPDEKWSG